MLRKDKPPFELGPEQEKKWPKALWMVFLVLIFFYFIVLTNILYSSRQESARSKNIFFKKSPDLIAIFTGHHGRIPYGFEVAQTHEDAAIFITGVYNKNSVETLTKSIQGQMSINQEQVTIDYFAKNTIENVIETLRLVEKESLYKSVLIISHDYHLNRIRMITRKLKSKKMTTKFYFEGVKSDFSKLSNIKRLLVESVKTIRSWVLLSLWPKSI